MNPLKTKSDYSWGEFEILFKGKFGNGAANRLYYSVFQAIFGYISIKEVGGFSVESRFADGKNSKHEHILNFLHANESKEYYNIFASLRTKRVVADYKKHSVQLREIEALEFEARKLREHFLGSK